MKTLKTMTDNFNESKKKLDTELVILKTLKTDYSILNERFKKLEKEHHQVNQGLMNKRVICKKLDLKIEETEKYMIKITQEAVLVGDDLIKVQKELDMKAIKLKEIERDLINVNQCLENKNISYKKVQNHIQRLEIQLTEPNKDKWSVEVTRNLPELNIINSSSKVLFAEK